MFGLIVLYVFILQVCLFLLGLVISAMFHYEKSMAQRVWQFADIF